MLGSNVARNFLFLLNIFLSLFPLFFLNETDSRRRQRKREEKKGKAEVGGWVEEKKEGGGTETERESESPSQTTGAAITVDHKPLEPPAPPVCMYTHTDLCVYTSF